MDFIGEKVFVVAEISGNHKQDYDKAVDLVYHAQQAGADAVKIQMYTADSLANIDGKPIEEGLWKGKTLHEIYRRSAMPYPWVPRLMDLAARLGVKLFASVYDVKTLDITEAMGMEAYKISSFEANDERLLKAVAAIGKPVFVSTGLSTFNQVRRIRKICPRSILLKCTSRYPAPLEAMNLRTIADMRRRFGGVIGVSDHTTSFVVPVAAVSMGARVIEKHFTIDEDAPDAPFSCRPEWFKNMVEVVRAAETAMGTVLYGGESRIRRMDGKRVYV